MLKQLLVGFLAIGVLGCDSSGAATPAAGTPNNTALARAPDTREVTVAAGTILHVTLESPVASDTSHVEDRVRAQLRQAVVVGHEDVIPRASRIEGFVSDVRRPGKVKGRSRVSLLFNTLVLDDTVYTIETARLTREGPATKKRDAEQIGIPAAGGAIIGAIVGGKKGAAVGATVGGGGGTAYVLSTRGKDIRLASGTPLSVRLAQPVTLRVPVSGSDPRPASSPRL